MTSDEQDEQTRSAVADATAENSEAILKVLADLAPDQAQAMLDSVLSDFVVEFNEPDDAGPECDRGQHEQ